jgi:flagellar motor component MotA
MKSAYELAMERLDKSSPLRPMTEEKKHGLAELDTLYRAKIAERKIFLESQLRTAVGTGEEEPLRRQLASEIARLEEELEGKKEALRNS